MSIKITEQNFDTEVLQSAMPVVVDFWADWCGPCKMMGPVLEDLAAAHPTVKVGKLNTDENLKLAMARKIDAIPALLLFRNGQEVSRSVGYKPAAAPGIASDEHAAPLAHANGDRRITTHSSELSNASEVLLNCKIEKLPVVDDEGHLVGLITYKDITKVQDHPNACKDAKGRLRVAAGVGITPDALDRVKALVEEDVDAVVLDSAHGHSMNIVNKLKEIKAAYPSLDVVVGNIATAGAARFLIENGADGIKVGIGPGSICTTRVIAGVGVPQLSAIYAAASAAKDTGVPVIADGGLRYSGDIVKALAAGGDCVMIGSMFAGTEESPGETIIYNGRKFKTYRGMGSIDAMKAGSADRYFQKGCEGNINKLVPEGIVARVPFKGTLSEAVFQLIGGIRSGMGYCGARDIAALQRAQFIRITSNGVTENHPHDVTITSETPNYSRGE